MDDSSARQYLHLEVAKEGVVTGADITEVAGVEIVNKDLAIATLDAGAKLVMEIEISKGRGYAEENLKVTRPAGFMPIDSIFSPILKVHYDVEPARVGQKTDYDRLIIEITTDGTLEPRVALHKAAVRLSQSLHIFTVEGAEAEFDEVPQQEEAVKEEETDSEVLSQPVEMLELSQRSLNCLKAANIKTIGELTSKTEKQLNMVKNFGARSLQEVQERLAAMKLKLAEIKE